MNTLIARVNPYLAVLGVGWLVPVFKMATGDSPSTQLRELWRELGIPLLALALFVAAWAGVAAHARRRARPRD
jgi:nitrate/nitrite transport system permease protein